MKQVTIQLDDATAAQPEKVAPGSRRKRSEFLRGVIARALHETLELGTRKAYQKWPNEALAVERADSADEDEAMRPVSKKPRAARPRKKAQW